LIGKYSEMKNASRGVKRVLVVEDEPSVSRVCLKTLTGEGLEVNIAVNGSVAEDILKKTDYDLILIDIRTPVMNGKELYQHISEKHPELAERVIFTTGDVLGGDNKRFLEQSGRVFLLKPFTPDELKAVVRETLRQLEK